MDTDPAWRSISENARRLGEMAKAIDAAVARRDRSAAGLAFHNAIREAETACMTLLGVPQEPDRQDPG